MRQIRIRQVSNGWIVTEVGASFNMADEELAVFNEMDALTIWLAKNFKLPEAKKEAGGQA
jgi:hypothetical protein